MELEIRKIVLPQLRKYFAVDVAELAGPPGVPGAPEQRKLHLVEEDVPYWSDKLTPYTPLEPEVIEDAFLAFPRIQALPASEREKLRYIIHAMCEVIYGAP